MKTAKELEKISKFLSYVLRHKPESIGLVLDSNGWASVADLLTKAKIDKSDLEDVVKSDEKQRYAFSSDGTMIRASQGHSVPVDLGIPASVPPDELFHGTALRFLDSIKEHGLTSQSRTHVHLSLDKATAHAVGARHGEPVVLSVDAAAMHKDGIAFHLSENGVWLTKLVYPKYIIKVSQLRMKHLDEIHFACKSFIKSEQCVLTDAEKCIAHYFYKVGYKAAQKDAESITSIR